MGWNNVYPTIGIKMSAWEKYKESLKNVTPLDMVNPNSSFVSKDIQTNRFELCKSCPQLIKLTNQCKQCGCFMSAKTKLEKAVCPIGKW